MAMVLGGGTFAREGEQRVFAYAVLASIVLHGALLFVNLQLRSTPKKVTPAPGPIVARLAAPRPVAAPAPVEPESKPRAEEPPPPPPVAKPLPVPAPVAKAAPAAPVVPSRPVPSTPPSEAAKPAVAPPAPVAPSAPSAAPSSPGPVAKADPQPAPTAPTESADAGTLDQYRIAIYAAAKKYKRYPRVAMDNNWEGKVVIRMVIGANTMISSMSIKTSSGQEVLDQAAMETLRKTKPVVPIPSALRGKEFSVDVNFIYNLKDENA